MTKDIDDSPDDGVKITYFVEGVALTTEDPSLTAGQVLESAGLSSEDFLLVSSEDKIYESPQDPVDVHDGDKFTVKRRPDAKPTYISYEVNGEDQRTEDAALTVEEILRKAGRKASIDVDQIGSYFLQDLADGRKYESLSDDVHIKEGDRFLAVHRGRTPVAWTR